MTSSTEASTFGERLYRAMEQADLNNTEVASEVGVSDKTIGRYLDRNAPPSLDKKKTEKTIESLAELLDVRFDWLLNGEGPVGRGMGGGPTSGEQSLQISDSLHRVPEVEVKISSDERPHLDQVRDGFFASTDYLWRTYGVQPEKLCLMRVTGDSMKSTLEPGQRVVLVRWDGEDLRDGAIYCLHGPTGFMLRRLRFGRREGEDMIEICSENDETDNWWTGVGEFKDKYTPLARGVEVMQEL